MKLKKFTFYIVSSCLLVLLTFSIVPKTTFSSSNTYVVDSDDEKDDSRTLHNQC